MSFINKSYFVGERDVPNTTYLDAESLLENLINIHEREFLIKALGYDLFSKFIAALKAGGAVPERYLDLLFGADFVGLDTIPTRWNGFVAVTAEIVADTPLEITIDGVDIDFNVEDAYVLPELVSPICDYVYYRWLRKRSSQSSDLGETKPDTQNSTIVSPRYRQTESWNAMVDKMIVLRDFMVVNYTVYPEFQLQNGRREHRLLLTKINSFF